MGWKRKWEIKDDYKVFYLSSYRSEVIIYWEAVGLGMGNI